jgi:tetratricopeptide (TPR) repeat protein
MLNLVMTTILTQGGKELLATEKMQDLKKTPQLFRSYCGARAMAFLTEGKPNEALEEYTKYLDASNWTLTAIDDQSELGDSHRLLKGLARDYLYLGKTLKALKRQEDANTVFNMALSLSPRNNNGYYQDQIRDELTRS